MARTWSVPQRGSVAAVSGLENERRGLPLRSPGGLAFGYRGLILLFAAVLTVGGVAVPHLDLQLFSTIFFITGAGLATLVVVLPWQSPSQKVITAPAPVVACNNGSGNYQSVTAVATDNCGIQDIGYVISGATSRSGDGADASGNFQPGVSTIT